MKLEQLTFAVLLAYLWAMMILLGSIVLEQFMVYPNIFYNAPESLVLAMEFLRMRGPDDFFPPLGFFSWLSGAAALALGWRVPTARPWILASLLMILTEGVASITLFWPRNEIMFVEGLAVHSPEVLRQTAEEFRNLHWIRLACNVVGSICIFVGFLKFYRHYLLNQVEAGAVRSPGVVEKPL
jgi:hypothetical protein